MHHIFVQDLSGLAQPFPSHGLSECPGLVHQSEPNLCLVVSHLFFHSTMYRHGLIRHTSIISTCTTTQQTQSCQRTQHSDQFLESPGLGSLVLSTTGVSGALVIQRDMNHHLSMRVVPWDLALHPDWIVY